MARKNGFKKEWFRPVSFMDILDELHMVEDSLSIENLNVVLLQYNIILEYSSSGTYEKIHITLKYLFTILRPF